MTPEEAIDRLDMMIADDNLWEQYTQDGKDAFQQALQLGREALEKQIELEKTKKAISAFLGQSGECDGYLACVTIDHEGHFHAQGEVIRDYDELMDWYKQVWGKE